MYLEDSFDQSTGPLPLFPVIFPTWPNFTSLGEVIFQLGVIWMYATLL